MNNSSIIRQNLKKPIFPNRQFNVLDFGANPDRHDNTLSINQAIKICHHKGGGQVLVPAGRWQTGAIELLSNVNLHLEEGAVLSFSTCPDDYLPAVKTRWEGVEMMGYSPLVYAYRQKNIAITGKGTLDGNANNKNWWPWKGKTGESTWVVDELCTQHQAREALFADGENLTPVAQRHYGKNSFLRPSFIQPYDCESVLIEGISIENAPFWLVHPVLCRHVTVKGVSMLSHGPNSDGCDPESCDHVLIEDCLFNTGDDCIAIKSGRNGDGRRINIPCENIVIANCKMLDGHGGVTIGSEISGGVRNVFVEHCQMDSPQLERGIRIKTNSVRGGVIENIYFNDIRVGEVKNGIEIDFNYEEGDAGQFKPVVKNIQIQNMVCESVIQYPVYVEGYSDSPVQQLALKNCTFSGSESSAFIKNVCDILIENVVVNEEQVGV